jgi:hypothetical protein
MKTIHRFTLALGFALALLFGVTVRVHADMLPPHYDTFGPQTSLTFGGTGIPNDAVAFALLPPVPNHGTGQIASSFTQRYNNLPLTNDGLGGFTGTAGDDSANGKPGYARWNADIYAANIAGDLGQTAMVVWGWNPVGGAAIGGSFSLGSPLLFQDSWNFGMSFLGGTSFDPNVAGYGYFGVMALDAAGKTLNSAIVNIDTRSTVPDGGNTLGLLACAFGAIGLFARKSGAGLAFNLPSTATS